jgi:2-dehydropantoate 2-reductase
MRHILFYGSGAVNLSLMGWLARSEMKMTVLARETSASVLRAHPVQVVCKGILSEARPEVVTDLSMAEKPDLIVIGVKAYALNDAVAQISQYYGREMPVLSVLNGVRHVDLLTSKFTNACFATICYNAYRTSASRAEAMGRGPVVIACSRAADKHVKRQVFDLFKGRVEAVQMSDANDAACNKLIINLANALMTLVAFHIHRERDLKTLQHITANLMWEGVQVMRAQGVRDVRVPGLPSWTMLRLSRVLPQFITVPIFRKKMAASAINSMAQDIEAGAQTEIEELNGHFLNMARKTGIKVPYNEAVYQLFKEWAASGAEAMAPAAVLAHIRSSRKR